jgi:hypothetical protein
MERYEEDCNKEEERAWKEEKGENNKWKVGVQ